MAQRVCPVCGHVEGEYTFFCTECGTKTVESTASGPVKMKPPVDTEEQQREKYKTSEVNPNPMYGKKRITNGIINTTIPVDSPLPDGFWYGMKSQKSNNRKGSTGRFWITNGTKSKMISIGSVIPEGWRKGHHNFL